jgi:hypothetical protein
MVMVVMMMVMMVFESYFLILKLYHNRLIYHDRCRWGHLLLIIRTPLIISMGVWSVAMMLISRATSGTLHLGFSNLWAQCCFIKSLVDAFEENLGGIFLFFAFRRFIQVLLNHCQMILSIFLAWTHLNSFLGPYYKLIFIFNTIIDRILNLSFCSLVLRALLLNDSDPMI